MIDNNGNLDFTFLFDNVSTNIRNRIIALSTPNEYGQALVLI